MRVIRLAVLGAAAMMPSGVVAAGSDTFCQRLAPKLAMKQSLKSSGDASSREWKINLLGGLGPALFGGVATASFSVRPIDPATGAEYRRTDGACSTTDKGAVCNIEGPAHLTIRTKGGEVVTDALAGESAVIEMRKTTIYCRQL